MTLRTAFQLMLLSTASIAPRLVAAADGGTAVAVSGEAGHAAPDAAAPAADPFPNACVDCHLNYADRKMDVRLSTLMQAWREKVDPKLLAKARAATPAGAKLEGRHPEARGALASIPGGCLSCHGKGSSRAPPFSTLIHSIHLSGGAENHYVAMFQGKCTHCHKLEPATGRMKLPTAPER